MVIRLVADRYVNDAQKRGLTCGVYDEVAVRKDTVSEQNRLPFRPIT